MQAFDMYLKIAQPPNASKNDLSFRKSRYHWFTVIKFFKIAIQMDKEIEKPTFFKLSNF